MPDGSQGEGADVAATASKDINGGHVQMSFRDKYSFTVKSCPNANGEVPGMAMQE